MSNAPAATTLGFTELLPEAIFAAAERLGGRATGRFLQLNAMENRVYDVQMEEGANRVVKFYRPGRWSAENIRAEHRFLLACAEEEIPVVAPLTDPSGESLFETLGIFYAVYPKRPGRLEPELSPAQLERLGRYLARLHLVGERHPTMARMHLNPTTYGREPLAYLEREKLLSPGLGPIFARYVHEICDRLDPLFERFPSSLVHGDVHLGNLLWRDDEPSILDFDDMVFAPPVQDVWMVVGADDVWGKKNLEILMDAYEEIRAFDWASLKLVEGLRALRIVHFSGWIARRRDDGAFKLAFPAFGTERYWQEQIEALSAQVEKLRALELD